MIPRKPAPDLIRVGTGFRTRSCTSANKLRGAELGEELVDLTAQAAATLPRSPATDCTTVALSRVAAVAPPTRSTSPAVSLVRCAAVSTLRAISCVAAPCSRHRGGDRAGDLADRHGWCARSRRSPRSSASWRAAWPAICVVMSSVARAVWPASAFTSPATTAKPRPGVAGARGLDGGVERQQIGLLGDVGDQADHVADAPGRFVELRDGRVGPFGLADRPRGDVVRLRHLPVDFRHRGGELFGGGRDVAHVGGGVFGRRRGARRAFASHCRRRPTAAWRPPASGPRCCRAPPAWPRHRRRSA